MKYNHSLTFVGEIHEPGIKLCTLTDELNKSHLRTKLNSCRLLVREIYVLVNILSLK